MRRQFGEVTVNYHAGNLQTTMPNGVVLDAMAHDTAEYAATAARLGYQNVEVMNRDHDLTHSLLAHWLGLRCSPTLEGVADGVPSTALTDAEEDAVLAIQRFANMVGVNLFEVA